MDEKLIFLLMKTVDVAREESRRAQTSAKTARLRAERLAKQAAKRDSAEKPKTPACKECAPGASR
jgi:hypothetical protein